MKAAVVGENALEIREVAQPRPKPSEVLVRVRAIGLNRAELPGSYGSGHTRATGSIPGIEWSGEVVECGTEVRGVKPGDRVMCAGQGGYAEYAVADYGRTAPIPDNNMSWEQAATYPSALGTMHDAIVTNARLQRGETVIIQGASSGVGLMGLQIAKLRGAKLVIGTSTNETRRARLKEFGADLVIDPGKAGWSEEVLKATDGKGAEVIIDMVSGPALNENMKAAAVLGRIVNVGHRLHRSHSPHAFDGRTARRSQQHARRSMGRRVGRETFAADRSCFRAQGRRGGSSAHAHECAFRQNRHGAVTAGSDSPRHRIWEEPRAKVSYRARFCANLFHRQGAPKEFCGSTSPMGHFRPGRGRH
jgi:NADPH:quinone reductase